MPNSVILQTKLRSLVWLLLCSVAFAQGLGGKTGLGGKAGVGGGFTVFVPITLEASCSGDGTTNYLACGAWTPVNPTNGDAVTCNIVGVSGGSGITGEVMDVTNGYYDNVYGIPHPVSSTSWVATANLQNFTGGAIAPTAMYNTTPGTRSTISCYAWKNVPTSNVLDGGAVEQTQSATAVNPTSGSATAPTNPNTAVIAFMSRSSATAPNSGGGNWLPVGALTLVGSSSARQASEYQIQGTASAVGGEFTGNAGSVAFVDSQLAILPFGQSGGYRALSGFFIPLGAPASAPTGTVSAATMGGATSTLASSALSAASPFWVLTGTAPTYDTGINPTGTAKIMVQQSAHTFGDAGSSVLYNSAAGAAYLSLQDKQGSLGTRTNLFSFYRMASSGATNGTLCDCLSLSGGAADFQIIAQSKVSTSGGLHFNFILEPFESGSSQLSSVNLSADTDYWLQLQVAGVNERYHHLYISAKSGGVWSLVDTLDYDHLCTNGNHASCTTPAAVVAPTGTASSGSTALTISSGTSTANGQLVLDNVNNCIPWPTLVEAGGTTTSITLSQKTTCAISSTVVSFYTVPAQLAVATNGTVTAGSTALTVVAPGVGTISAGQEVGGLGIAEGTTVSSVAGTAVTLSLPATATKPSGEGVSFWTTTTQFNMIFGRYSSCNVTSSQWWSAMMFDYFNTRGAAYEPN